MENNVNENIDQMKEVSKGLRFTKREKWILIGAAALYIAGRNGGYNLGYVNGYKGCFNDIAKHTK